MLTAQEVRLKALELAIDFSKGFNHNNPEYKCSSAHVLEISRKFEDYIKDGK